MVRRERTVLAALFLAFFLSAPAAAQEVESNAPLTARTTHNLSGTVMNSLTGEPVRRALVQAGSSLGGSPLSVLTDPEGRFVFPNLPESEIVLSVRKPGFFSESELHPEAYQPEIVHLAEDTSSLVLKLLPESSVSGHVSTLKGDPVEDSPVRVFGQRIIEGRRRWDVRGQAMTDEDGQFRLANLPPGQYVLATGPNLSGARFAFAQARSVRAEGFATIFYPGVPEFEGATVLNITGGQQVQADFALKPEPIFTVSGTAIGAPGPGTSVQFMTKAGEFVPVPINFDPQTGKFQAKIPGGSYTLRLRAPDASGQMLGADVPLVVRSDLGGISVPLGPSLTLPIVVDLRQSGTAREQSDARLLPRTNSKGFSYLRLISVERRLQAEELMADRNEKGGGLAVHNLSPGRYSVDIGTAPGWYVRSVGSGTTDLLREDLVIAPGRQPDPLEVVLRDDVAGLRGTIRVNGEPAAGTVVLFSDQASAAHARTAVAQKGTEFMFTDVAPGDYKVLAFDSVDDLEFRNPEELSPYVSKAVSVTLQPNETANITVERISRAK